MAKPAKSLFVCQSCGSQATKWAGQCSDCGAWNSYSEITTPTAGPAARSGGYAGVAQDGRIQRLSEVRAQQQQRIPSGLSEFDRVLGGGFVPGSVILIGGDPGIGKSTLLLQVLMQLQGRIRTLYVTGEESPEQVRLRAERMGSEVALAAQVGVLAETGVENILATSVAERPQLLVIDSVQTIYTEALSSAPGSVSQLRESTALLVRHAKQSQTVILLVGHVTKEGTIAGPRVLEHMVDTVLYFENDRGSRYRVIRAAKNRFGAVNELGFFAMTDGGLKEVSNPSAVFLSRHPQPVPGSVVMVAREGSRPLLVEVQALVDDNNHGQPRRVALGPDQTRLGMLLAVLHRHGGIVTHDQDVFVNVVGGVRVNETAADLPVLLAVQSSLRGQSLPQNLIVFGEVGLAGEIRPVQAGEERLKEAAKHGFTRAIVPRANQPRSGRIRDMEVLGVDRLSEALSAVR